MCVPRPSLLELVSWPEAQSPLRVTQKWVAEGIRGPFQSIFVLPGAAASSVYAFSAGLLHSRLDLVGRPRDDVAELLENLFLANV